MTGRPRIPLCLAGLLVVGALALPATAGGQEVTTPEIIPPGEPSTDGTAPAPDSTPTPDADEKSASKDGRAPAHISVGVHGIHRDHMVRVGKPVRAFGYLRPYVPGEHVRVKLLRKGKVVRNVNPEVNKVPGKNKGRFNFKSKDIIKPGTYKVLAMHKRSGKQRRDVDRSHKFGVRYPDLDSGNRSSVVKVFNRVLRREGYFTSRGKKYSVRTKWAVMAFRKVNGMKRTFNANPKIFRTLADGRGAFDLKYPGKGKHVEVDISKQVMVLAKRRKPQHTFAVSTGAPATPTIRGHFRFYRKDAGYNSVGMYYSVYFHGGYATHGYHSVPTYPASHGCVRNPIPDSIFIYNWISLGDSIYVYG